MRDDNKTSGVPSDTFHEIELTVGSFSQIMDSLSIRQAKQESFDVSSFMARADAIVPGMGAIADAVNQYGFAIVRFPEGKCWNDLIPRRTPGYEGWLHFAARAKNGGVGGGNAAIMQAGLQPVAIANLALQAAAVAVGLAYMARIDGKLSEICEGIDEILRRMEEDYISQLGGIADTLSEYREYYDEYASNDRECSSIIANTQRIYEKLRGYWRKELLRMEHLQGELESQGKIVQEADARDLLQKYVGIETRLSYIFGLTIISREIGMQYGSSFASGRIDRERKTISSMRDEYVNLRDKTVRSFNKMAEKINAPLHESVPQAFQEQTNPMDDLLPASFKALLGSFLAVGIGGAIGTAALAARVSEGVDNINSQRQSQYLRDVSHITNYIEETANAYSCELDNLDFRFNKANALLIGPDGISPLVVINEQGLLKAGTD